MASLKPIARIAGLLCSLLAVPALAGLSMPGALNYDNSWNSEFRAGNKPVAGGACPTGWTCTVAGDATEDIDEVSATSFLMVVSGSDEGSIGYAYKNTASDDDVEIIARVPATWGGGNDAQFGVMLLDNAGYRAHCYWRNGSGNVKFKTDVDGAGEVQQGGLANQTRPRYVGLSYLTADTIGCFESTDGIDWSAQVGTHVSKVLSFPVRAGPYGTSYNPVATITATPTGIAFSNTPTIEDSGGGDPDPPPNVAPVFNSIPLITGTAGTAKSIQILNLAATDDCTKILCDDNGDALTLTEQGCTWPTGVDVSSATGTVEIATNAVAGTTPNCQIGASDGVAARVDSTASSIVIAPAGGGEEDATLTWVGLLEDGTLSEFKTKTAQQGQQSVVTTAVGCDAPRQGTYMAKLEIPAGATGTPQRAEIKSSPNIDFLWDETEYWVGFSFCVPATLTGVNTLFQIHASNEAPGSNCDLAGNAIGINGASGTLGVIENPSGISEASGANSNQIQVFDFNLDQAANQDVWHDVVLNFALSKTGTGFYTFYVDGVVVAQDLAASNTNWKDSCGVAIAPPKDSNNGIHVGLYKSSTSAGIIYFDAMRVAEGDNGFNTVDPAQDD